MTPSGLEQNSGKETPEGGKNRRRDFARGLTLTPNGNNVGAALAPTVVSEFSRSTSKMLTLERLPTPYPERPCPDTWWAFAFRPGLGPTGASPF